MGMRTSLAFLAIAVVVSMVLATGCRNRSRSGRVGGDTDSGMIMVDSGPPDATDGGPIVLMDSGMPPRDSGGPPAECVTDSECLSSEQCSSGMCVPRMTMTCTLDTIAPYPGAACSASTRSCISDCAGDGACIDGCIAADSNPECGLCLNQNTISCINSMGCQDEWNCYNQCFIDHACTDRACVDANCSAEDADYGACADTLPAGACSSALESCFSA